MPDQATQRLLSLGEGFAWATRALLWLLLPLAIGVVAATALLALTDLRLLAVTSGSMRPAIDSGDAVLVSPLKAGDELAAGDVVLVRTVGSNGRVHRIELVNRDAAGNLLYRTAGDANAAADPGWATRADIEGRVRFVVPEGGNVLIALTQPLTRFALFVLPVLLLALEEAAAGLGLAVKRAEPGHALD